jgi:glucose-1-phosphate adenylyltransferase
MRDLVTFVLAGGHGTRLYPLTLRQAKPALSFGGTASLLDVTLLNCYRCGVPRVYLLLQYHAESIVSRVRSGWSSVEARGGMAVFCRASTGPSARYRGTADAVWRNLDLVPEAGGGDVLVLSGDHVYDMDYRRFLRVHRESGADMTIGSTLVPLREAPRFGVLACSRDGRVVAFWEKPARRDTLPVREVQADPLAAPEQRHKWVSASMGVYAFRAGVLRRVLEDGPGADRAFDFGRDIIPALVEQGRVYAYDFVDRLGQPCYWRDVGTVRAYHDAQMELVASEPAFRLRAAPAFADTRLGEPVSGEDVQSMIAASSEVRGDVFMCLVSPGSVIRRGARVRRSVVLEGAVVEAGAVVEDAVLGQYARVAEGAAVGRGTGEEFRYQVGRVYRTLQEIAVVPAFELVAPAAQASTSQWDGVRSLATCQPPRTTASAGRSGTITRSVG